MIASGSEDGKWRKMNGHDVWRTIECLRGRLLKERVASRAAKEDADQIGNKLTELENQLKLEIKTRNRAEKRLKLLVKKLETLNISYISDNSQQSSSVEKSDLSSVSSSASWAGDREAKTQFTDPPKCELEVADCSPSSSFSTQKIKSSQDSEDNASQVTTASNASHGSPVDEPFSSPEKANFTEPSERDDLHRSSSGLRPSREEEEEVEEASGENCDQADQEDDHVDYSLALVPVELPVAAPPPATPVIVSPSVKDALEALREAKEKLLMSMERRTMIRVVSK